MLKTKLLWSLLLVTSTVVLGQSKTVTVPITPAKPPQVAAASQTAESIANVATKAGDYSSEPAVIEKSESVYTMAADGTGSRRQTIVVRVQSDAAVRQLGVLNVQFAGNSEKVELTYVRVRRPDGTVTETPVNEAIEMPSPVTTQAPFYSDLKQMQIPVRNLRAGDTLEWQVNVRSTKAEAPGQFWGSENFVSDAVILAESLELRVPKNSYVNVWSPKHKPAETVDGEQRVFRWTAVQLKPTVGKEADAEKERKKKHVLTDEEQLDQELGIFPDVAWSTFKSWEAVGEWYRSLEIDRVAPDAEVKAKVAEITAGKASEEEKVRAVYAYVATQIRYIGVAFGIGRYQPHHASEVLENQYGDCKDKHTLLASMLTVLGVHPSAVLIGAGVRFNEAVPSPQAFNHLITTAVVNGKQVWLDSTSEVAPYRVLLYAIRDKQALVIPEAGSAAVERTPAGLPFDQLETLDATGTLDKDGTANLHMVLTLRGDNEVIIRSAFHATQANQYQELTQRMSQGMGFGGTTSNVQISRAEETAEPFNMNYDYKREKPGNDWDNLRIVPMLLPASLPRVEDSDPPVEAVWLGMPRFEHSTSSLKLPDGWGAVLPEAIHVRSAYVNYDETYHFDKGILYAERKVEVLQKKVPVSDWKRYKKWVDAVNLGTEQYVQLTRKETGEPSKAETGGNSDHTSSEGEGAAKLIDDARQAIQRNDLAEAKSLLDSARNKSETQPYLWAVYGFLDFRKGDMPSTITDYQKEITLHSESYGVYAPLAQVQVASNQRDAAKETLRKWAAVQPDNPQPSVMLASFLLEDGDAAGAVTAVEAGIAHLPEQKKDNESLQLLLGRAQKKAGMSAKSEATLLALMQSTQDPGMMNDSAYELADAGQQLPLTESITRTALDKLAEESKTWTLDEDPQKLLAKTRLIAATWDTLGWILFREGKSAEAEGYIRASWLNRTELEVGKHLGEIDTAQGRKADALRDYELAVATVHSYNMMGVRTPPTPQQKELMERIDALHKAGVKSTVGDSHEGLVKMRTISLSAAGDLKGGAEYRMLLSDGKVTKVESSGSKDLPKELPGGVERIMHAKLPGFWPPGSSAALVRMGVLNCHAAVCELVLEP